MGVLSLISLTTADLCQDILQCDGNLRRTRRKILTTVAGTYCLVLALSASDISTAHALGGGLASSSSSLSTSWYMCIFLLANQSESTATMLMAPNTSSALCISENHDASFGGDAGNGSNPNGSFPLITPQEGITQDEPVATPGDVPIIVGNFACAMGKEKHELLREQHCENQAQ
ncbi:hypothetical protein NE237_003353 [Protea cynaroides]|uniref:Uncharacterized protein n=1 Tax=Protea cynaroides TaxID=273540 RepID=A0A9Q0KH94_9MAGN|nr:hypothetical protein NE237_003353 [Protea cynaroides]